MMRYSFKEFLKYQNELNNRYDKEKVEHIIDDILNQLRLMVELYPTSHKCKIYNSSYNDDCYYDLHHCSLSELREISNYFEDMGFTVTWVHYQDDETRHIQSFEISW